MCPCTLNYSLEVLSVWRDLNTSYWMSWKRKLYIKHVGQEVEAGVSKVLSLSVVKSFHDCLDIFQVAPLRNVSMQPGILRNKNSNSICPTRHSENKRDWFMMKHRNVTFNEWNSCVDCVNCQKKLRSTVGMDHLLIPTIDLQTGLEWGELSRITKVNDLERRFNGIWSAC